MPKYRDFSEMSDDALRALANDMSDPKAALKRIRAERRAIIANSTDPNKQKRAAVFPPLSR